MNCGPVTLPAADIALNLPPEELAGLILVGLNREFLKEIRNNSIFSFSLHNLTLGIRNRSPELALAVSEALSWLIREGLLVHAPEQIGCLVPSRRAREFKTTDDVRDFRKAALLPRAQLHPVIAQRVSVSFASGRFQDVVFQAFQTVEVEVRASAKLPNSLIGVGLMRRAFDPENGALTDMTAEKGEREALSALFAGAIGSYKNPASHRHVAIEAEEAVEMIVLASHLLRIVGARAPKE